MKTYQTPKIALGTWSWGTVGSVGGNTVFGNQLDAEKLKDIFNTEVTYGLNLFDTVFAYAMGNQSIFLES